jgi:NTE family protein
MDAGRDPREGAREALKGFWDGIALMNALNPIQRAPFDVITGAWRFESLASNIWADTMSRFFSPAQSNPLDINPLRSFLGKHVDFERIGKMRALKIFVCATRVANGKAEVFAGNKVTLDAVMASACLPALFRAVEIDGVAYWDGGYSGNPAMHPLIYRCESRDIMLVQINPVHSKSTPDTAREIMDRVDEITFNASLIAQMRAIDFVKRMLAQDRLDKTKYKDILVHRVAGGEPLERFGGSSKMSTDSSFLTALFDIGASAASTWLKDHFNDLGEKSSVNIAKDYLDDMRLGIVDK